jgi:PAS domain S-box-containing protein
MECKFSDFFSKAGSVRTKVWACVLIALAGYFIATISSFYSNRQQALRLGNLQNVHFPLARLSDETVNIFKTQIGKYEDAFLTGESEQAVQANRLSGRVLDLLLQMEKVAAQDPSFSFENALIESLGDRYREFSLLAADVYLSTQAIETSLEMQLHVQKLGTMQTRLLNDLNGLAQHLAHNVERIIQEERRHAQRNTIFLGILFVLVLASATLISRCFANRQLIQPLARIQEMVTRFAHNREIAPPEASGAEDDEINRLALSFWEMTQELKQTMVSRDYVDKIIKNMSGCLMVLAADQTLTRVNDRTKALLGLEDEELLGRRITDCIAPASLELFKGKALDVLARGQEVRNLEIRLRGGDGREVPVLFSGSLMRNADQEAEALICVANDITQRKKAEEMQRKMEVERALARTASLAAIGELTSSIAHEMRNPLSSIKMNARMLQQSLEEREPDLAELAEISSQQSLRLETMLNDLLNYGKPLTLRIGKTTARELFRATLIAVAQEKHNKEVLVEITNEVGEVPLQVDVELMIRALSNLVLNAIQWSPPRGTVHIAASFAGLGARAAQVLFQVRDDGPGIREDKIHRLFQPFFTTRPGGTGLGLAGVRKIVEYHGGTVSGANHPDGGAVFRIALPPMFLREQGEEEDAGRIRPLSGAPG